jgi:hypothetical protein
LGKCPLAFTERRKRALRLSIALVDRVGIRYEMRRRSGSCAAGV